jgi:hypothetical protein
MSIIGWIRGVGMSRNLLFLTNLQHLHLQFSEQCSDLEEREFVDNINKLTSLPTLRLEPYSNYYSYHLESYRTNFLRLILGLPPMVQQVHFHKH